MEEENNSIGINLSSKAIGKVIYPMAMEDKFLAMDKFMKVNGSMVAWKEKEYYSNKMAPLTQENGSIIHNTATVMKNGSMEHSMKAASATELNKDMES